MIRKTILVTCLVFFLLILLYGSLSSSHRVYETDVPAGAKVPLFTQIRESRLMAVSTFGGVRRDEDGHLSGDSAVWNLKQKKPCPT